MPRAAATQRSWCSGASGGELRSSLERIAGPPCRARHSASARNCAGCGRCPCRPSPRRRRSPVAALRGRRRRRRPTRRGSRARAPGRARATVWRTAMRVRGTPGSPGSAPNPKRSPRSAAATSVRARVLLACAVQRVRRARRRGPRGPDRERDGAQEAVLFARRLDPGPPVEPERREDRGTAADAARSVRRLDLHAQVRDVQGAQRDRSEAEGNAHRRRAPERVEGDHAQALHARMVARRGPARTQTGVWPASRRAPTLGSMCRP